METYRLQILNYTTTFQCNCIKKQLFPHTSDKSDDCKSVIHSKKKTIVTIYLANY